MILLLCTLTHTSSIPMGSINFYKKEMFLQALIPLLFPSLVWDVFTCKNVLYTWAYVFYSHGCNKFLHARTFFTLSDSITPIFTMLTKVWPHANLAMVTNNSTVLTEIHANRNSVNQGFPTTLIKLPPQIKVRSDILPPSALLCVYS